MNEDKFLSELEALVREQTLEIIRLKKEVERLQEVINEVRNSR
jgi:hypothetical protein